MSAAINALIEAERLPADYTEVVSGHWQALADRITEAKPANRPLVVGINGGQGSGKSTLCKFLEMLLAERGLRAVTLGLDDFYLTRGKRQQLAKAVHPLFATRGVPGTHDTGLLDAALSALLSGQDFALPQFDKAADDRATQPKSVTEAVDIILFEGWCVGTAPQADGLLASPINDLEREEDPDAVWRTAVNTSLKGDYARLFARIDLLVLLAVDGIDAVRRNRRLQEEKLAQSNPQGKALMDEAALERFIQHYERLTRHTLAEMPARADIIYTIGQNQRPTR